MQTGLAALLLGICLRETLATRQTRAGRQTLAGYTTERQYFTTNAICLRKHCVNPIFPALEDLGRLSESPWFCSSLFKARQHMGFCKGAVNYDPSFPMAEGAAEQTMEDIVQRQDGEAAKMFMYHLSGMGLEAWDYAKPELSDDDCVKSVWRMVCYTYFPRAPMGCQDGMQTTYMRPCKSSCQNYIRSCGVECCDESVQCVFTHTKQLSSTQLITTSGYLPHDGPSTLCTGAAFRGASPGRALGALLLLPLLWTDGVAALQLARSPRLLQLGVLALVPLLLQGCDYDVPSHTVGHWRVEPDYLIGFQFVPPGASAADGTLNSCGVENLALPLQCSGRGVCKTWDKDNLHSPTTFCECDRDWADPECKTRRKSQVGAFLLSLFFGFLGLDHFYMGFRISGTFKLLTLGGGGIWWVVDFIRIGSAAVAAKNFRLAADLPHWVFTISVVFFGMVLGFVIAFTTLKRQIVNQRKEAMMRAEHEEAYHPVPEKKHMQPRPEKPELRIGEPGMQLKFRASPAQAPYPTYGTMHQESLAAARPAKVLARSAPAVTKRAVSPAPRAVASTISEPVTAAAAVAMADTSSRFSRERRGSAQLPVATLGPMEPLASAASLQDSALLAPRVDFGSQRVPTAGPAVFTPSTISGLGHLPTTSAGAVHN